MLEAVIPVGIALASGFSILMTRLHSRVHELDRRLDGVELRIAEDYLTKTEFSTVLERVESHMVRIENKLDRIIIK
ncbi:MAG: hypothetical protein CMQ57_03410 [Gammaproteobacteria bacterium]|jgi:uncharacterized coiled-coil protein SlyX|nr:hypothetical protein [Gammaproteobacteria bacterium]|tara:strand:+ start:1615 stop:1842 length:228 start_codon:yes stop_codon:yes gene_type:complete